MMKTLGAAAGCAVLSLYSSILLKIYLDIFLHQASGRRQTAGWFLFFTWQYLSESGRYNEQMTLCFTFVSIIFIGMAAYTGNWWKRCVFPVVYLAVWMLLEGVAAFGIGLASGGVKTEFAMISVVSKILLLFFVLKVKSFSMKMGSGREPYGGSICFLAMPIAGMGLYHTLYQFMNHVQGDYEQNRLWMLVIAIALIVMNLSFYPMYIQLIKGLHMKKSANFYMKQLELFRQEKQLEDNAVMEIRELRHDMKQHLFLLNSLLQNGEIEAARNMLEELTRETLEKGRLESRTGNMVVDSLINHTWKTAKEKGIRLHLDIRPLPELAIKDSDLCILLGNALDNALEASEQVQNSEKEIWIFAVYEKGYLLFQVKNRYEGELRMSSGQRIPSRKREAGHGFGLYSMDKIAKKYGGSMEVKLEEQGIFLVEILICCG